MSATHKCFYQNLGTMQPDYTIIDQDGNLINLTLAKFIDMTGQKTTPTYLPTTIGLTRFFRGNTIEKTFKPKLCVYNSEVKRKLQIILPCTTWFWLILTFFVQISISILSVSARKRRKNKTRKNANFLRLLTAFGSKHAMIASIEMELLLI